MTDETIWNSIEAISRPGLSRPRLMAHARRVVRSLKEYTVDSDKLPPQTLIPCCLFVLPEKLKEALEVPQEGVLSAMPDKVQERLLIHGYLICLESLLANSTDEIKHVIAEGMVKAIPLAHPYPKILKRYFKTLISLWAASSPNLNLSLRCYLCLRRYTKAAPNSPLFGWALQRMIVLYLELARNSNSRTADQINLLINSVCDFVALNPDTSYVVLFGCIRTICLKIDTFNKTKKKEKSQALEKLYSFQVLHTIKLLSAVVSKVPAKEVNMLIYPLLELIGAYERLSEAHQYLPLKMKLLTFSLDVSEQTGVFPSICLHLFQKVITSPLFLNKLHKKSTTPNPNIDFGYKLAISDLTSSGTLNYLFQGCLLLGYQLMKLFLKSVWGPQPALRLIKNLKAIEFIYGGYRDSAKQALKMWTEDVQTQQLKRAHRRMSLKSKAQFKEFEAQLAQWNNQTSQKYEHLLEEAKEKIKQDIEAQALADAPDDQEDAVRQNSAEIGDEWESAGEGASDFEASNSQEEPSEQGHQEQVSYEGDPDSEEAEKAIDHWEEKQWSSQDEM